jgi:molybdopterin synthase catalytic subunit
VLFEVTRQALDIQRLIDHVREDESGAVALFLGVVRNNSLGRRVLHLDYDAYPEMAEKVMGQVAQETTARWPLSDVAIQHRIGRLEIGQASLAVAVASPHRQEAFQACHYIVDRVKEVVPIWKKEVWEGGEVWIEGEPVGKPEARETSSK